MTTRPQPEPHLDADQLTAFAEGALSTSERALCLQHLAECAHCREIAFLASAVPATGQTTPAPVRSFWRFWWPALSLGAATIATVVIAVLFVRHPHQKAPAANVQIATGAPTIPTASPSTAAPMNQSFPREKTRLVPKPSPGRKTVTKPKPEIPDSHYANNATASDSATASVQAGAAVQQQLASAGRAVQTAPSAAPSPLGQMAQPQLHSALKAGAASAAPLYDKLERRTPDGSAQISGTITDSSGATIPHAKVSLDQTSGPAHRETLTDAAGRFAINSLQPGKYRLEISSPGFLAQVREVEIGASQLARVDSQLTVGATSETVAVQAAAPALTTESLSEQSVLPDKQPPQSAVSSGGQTLALDAAGKLFLSKAGKRWKAVHGPWKKSAVIDLSVTPDRSFKVSTSQGSWLSADGEHWHPAD